MSAPDPIRLREAAAFFRQRLPDCSAGRAVVCGSGWSGVVEDLEILDSVPFDDIPGLGPPGVVGHAGEVVLGQTGETQVLVFKGRRHFYEGEGWTPVAMPVFLCRDVGVTDLLLTNSAGAVNPAFEVGDLMALTDHINLIGDNPLVGPHREEWGPRFPDLSHVYGEAGLDWLDRAAAAAGVELKRGVYAATRGPVYETPAEVRAWKTLGADAVGMSTVPEAILAHAAGLHVAAVSCMTNFAAGISPRPLSHEEVTETTARAMPKMRALVLEWIRAQ